MSGVRSFEAWRCNAAHQEIREGLLECKQGIARLGIRSGHRRKSKRPGIVAARVFRLLVMVVGHAPAQRVLPQRLREVKEHAVVVVEVAVGSERGQTGSAAGSGEIEGGQARQRQTR